MTRYTQAYTYIAPSWPEYTLFGMGSVRNICIPNYTPTSSVLKFGSPRKYSCSTLIYTLKFKYYI